MSIVNYIASSHQDSFKKLFEDKGLIIKNCIFYLYYNGNKTKQLAEYKDVFYKIPYEEMMLIDLKMLLEKVYIIDVSSVTKLNLKGSDLIKQLEDVNEIIGEKVKIPMDPEKAEQIQKEQIEKEEQLKELEEYIESDEEKQVEGGRLYILIIGTTIEIHKELRTESTKTFLDRMKNEKIIAFSISHNNFNTLTHFQSLINSLIKCDSLKSFTFTENNNTTGFEEGWKLIIKLLRENKAIRHLNLSMAFLYDKYLNEIFRDALKFKRIKSLDLSSNFITFPGSKKIAEWLKKNKSLKMLNLQQNTMNEFKKEGSDVIVLELISHPSIQSLDLSNMILTGFGEKLGKLIESSKTLKELKIKNNRMNLDDFIKICTPMCDNTTIINLNMSDNDCGTEKAFEYIAMFLEKNKTLKNLGLDKMGINSKNSDKLFDGIKINESIEFYSLNENVKMKIKNLLEILIQKPNVKHISMLNIKVKKEDEEMIEIFLKERSDVILKI